MTAMISIRDKPSISLPPREEVERLLALTTPPASPLTPLSSPLPQIPSPLLLPIPSPISSPPILLPSTDRRADRLEFCLPPRKRPTGGRRADYGFVSTIDTEIRRQRAKEKMAPKRKTRSTPETTTTTTSVTNAQLQEMIDQGVTTAQHVMQLGLAMTAIPQEWVLGGLNALLESAPIKTS
ncbi:hypothetical protein Tco_0931970 [Tanacetum coccineum]